MKYFMVVFMMSVFVLLYVWQNIEVMRMKMDYRKLIKVEHELTEENKRHLAELERLRNFRTVENAVAGKGVRRMEPQDMLVLKNEEKKDNGKNESK